MSTKTENYQLNQWAPGDPFLRTDFNEDHAKIDAALSGLSRAIGEVAVPKISVGSYVGSGQNERQNISLGFRPKAVIAWGNYSETPRSPTPTYSAMAVDGQNFSNALEITDTGFTAISRYDSLTGQYYPSLNKSSLTYLYLAIG